MFRFLLRFLGLVLLALAFIFLVYDGTKSIADQSLYWTRFEDVWNWLSVRPPQEVLLPLVDRGHLHAVWQPIILPGLRTPIWIILAILGSLLILLGRKKRRLIGYARD